MLAVNDFCSVVLTKLLQKQALFLYLHSNKARQEQLQNEHSIAALNLCIIQAPCPHLQNTEYC